MIEDRMYSAEEVAQALKGLASEVLDKTHPGWEDVVGLPTADDQGPPLTTYRQWLDMQPEEYRYHVLDTYSPVVIGESIDKFREWQWEVMQCEEAFRK